ncbi:MAG: YdcF family protein [Hyphomicrobium sp.]
MVETETTLLLANVVRQILSPLGATLFLIFVAILSHAFKKRRLTFCALFSAGALLWSSSSPFVSHFILGALERQYPPLAPSHVPTVDLAIVLGGVSGAPLAPRAGSQIGKGSDRVLLASRLYKTGKVKKIWFVGGDLPWLASDISEGQFVKDLLTEWGVPSEAIEIGSQSRNTYENVLEIQQMKKKSPFTSAILITSAWHMPRAMAIFRKALLPVVAVPADVRIVHEDKHEVLRWLPDAEALEETSLAVKERIGYFVYWLRGYL